MNKDFKIFTGEDLPEPKMPVQGQNMMQIRSQYIAAMCVPLPRDLDKIVGEVMGEARKAKDSFYYTWPVKSKSTNKSIWIIGGTVDLAQAIARSWTNCVADTTCKEQCGEWIFKTVFIDFEKGFTTSRELRMLIPQKGKDESDFEYERSRNTKFQIGQSKNKRNAIFDGVPRWLKNQAIEVAKLAGRKDTDYDKAGILKKAVGFFADKDINSKELCAFFSVQVLDDLTEKDVDRMRNLATQLTNGDVMAEDIKKQAVDEFGRTNREKTKPQKQTRKEEPQKASAKEGPDIEESPATDSNKPFLNSMKAEAEKEKKRAEGEKEKSDGKKNPVTETKKEGTVVDAEWSNSETETRKAAIEDGIDKNHQDATELKVLQDQIKNTQLPIKYAACRKLRWTRHEPDWIPETVSACRILIGAINDEYKANAPEGKGTR